jgi:hypothetical protein
MPSELPKDVLEAADAAIAFAQQMRKFHRRRTDRKSERRVEDIELALERLRAAMVPLRSEIGRFPYGPQTVQAESNREAIRAASEGIQRERRKLWKMRTKEEK